MPKFVHFSRPHCTSENYDLHGRSLAALDRPDGPSRSARLTGSTLLIAKLDRLSRDAHFLLGLQKAGVRFVAADMSEANELVVGIMAVIAQAEHKMISTHTKAALAEARKRVATRREEAGLSSTGAAHLVTREKL